MKLADVRKNAFAMPLNDPSYPKGPYKFYNREFVVITTAPIRKSCAPSCPSRSKWPATR
jgi:acetoacetate decarboxylase